MAEMAIIAISGLAGAGKTTLAELISKEMGYKLVVIGEIFREIAEERSKTLEEFGEYARSNIEIDLEVDKKQMEIALKEENLVLDSRLCAHLLFKNRIESLKIFLSVPLKFRARRIADRENISLEQASNSIIKRTEVEVARYKKFYSIDILHMGVYDVVINNFSLNQEETRDVVLSIIEAWSKR